MNGWLLAACVLLPAGMGPCLWRACRGEPAQRVTGMSLGGVVAIAVFLLTARGVHRTSYTDLALVMAVLAPAGTLVFARCLAGGAQESPDDRPAAATPARPAARPPQGHPHRQPEAD